MLTLSLTLTLSPKKYVTQSKYLNETETKETPTVCCLDQVFETFYNIIGGFVYHRLWHLDSLAVVDSYFYW